MTPRAALIILLCCLSLPAVADPVLLRIGTGGSGGTYFPIGSLIAEALSSRTGHRPADPDAVELLGVAQLSNGSVANVRDLAAGRLEAALAQADVAHWAYTGSGPFDGVALTQLRSVATLYNEHVHLVARPEAGIENIADLRGKRVSFDEPGSGTLIDVELILAAFGIERDEVQPVYLKSNNAAERLLAGQLDALFIIAGPPIDLVEDLLTLNAARLVAIDGPPIDALLQQRPFFSRATIAAGVYPGATETATLAVGAQLLVRADLDETLVYRVTEALWSPTTRRLLDKHSRGRDIGVKTAQEGLAVPLHAGAARYYRVHGDRVHGDPARDDRVHGDPARDDRVHGDRIRGDRVRGDRIRGDRVRGDRDISG